MRRLRIPLLLLSLAVLAAGVWAWRFFADLQRSGLPQRTGDAVLLGLEGDVEVRFDEWGVPHLRAGSLRDLAAGLGWVHANDRMDQMELIRRAAAGRLAELFGERLLASDRRSRELRLREIAERLWEAAGPDSRTWLTGYADGVNAWLAERGEDDLPPLYALAGAQPEPWRPQDSLAVPLLMAMQLSFAFGHSDEELYLALRALGAERFSDLWGPIDVPAGLLETFAAATPAPTAGTEAAAHAPPAGGSNEWAIAARHTTTGAPLFANDPHLALGLPSVWYEAHLSAPGFEVAGVGFPGVPVIVIGHSEHLAWGFTNLMLDDHDLLLEDFDASGTRVRRGEDWEAVQLERTTIRVRGGDPVELELRSTCLGPLLPADAERGLPPRSFLWTAFVSSDALAAFTGLARARDLEEAGTAARHFVCPAQNLVAVDRAGGLLQTVLGRLPARRRGDGRLPALAVDASYGWDGLQDAGDVFVVRDPTDGILVTANQDVRPPGWSGSLRADFDTEHRARRIRQRLVDGAPWDAAGLAALQTDVVDLYAIETIGLLGELALDGSAGAALAMLREWDGARHERGPSALFQRFERELAELLFRDQERACDAPEPSFFFRRPQLLRALRNEMAQDWWDDLGTPQREDRRAALRLALERAWEALDGGNGSLPERGLDYGNRHRLLLRHPLDAAPLLGSWFDRGPFALPGSATTVAAFGGDWSDGKIEVSYGPSFRFVADPADWDRSRFVLPGGQCGHPADDHYDDQLPLYLAGATRTMPWSTGAVEAATRSRLRLHR